MHAAHLLIGRPWQFDRDVTHQGKLNRYSLVFKGRKFTLAPLNPSDVYKDQLRMIKFCEGVREKEQVQKTERKEASNEKSKNLNGPKVSESASGKIRVKNLMATKKDVRRALLNKQPCILVRFRQNYLSLSNINENLPSVFQSLL